MSIDDRGYSRDRVRSRQHYVERSKFRVSLGARKSARLRRLGVLLVVLVGASVVAYFLRQIRVI